MKIIKLIYDKYENESYSDQGINKLYSDTDNGEGVIQKNAKKNVVYSGSINKDRILNIFTWGVKKEAGVECDITFDLRIFQTKISENINISEITGFSNIIQESIKNHPKFDELLDIIITEIEQDNPKKVAFVCNYGKHRSVGWAEIIKKYIYPNAKIKHLCQRHIPK